MKKYIIKAVLLSLLLFFSFRAVAEDYETGVGVRLGGYSQGINIKHFLSKDGAIEGILSFGYRSFLITGLYEKHFPIENAPGLNWYLGGGAHFGFYNYGYDYYYYHYHKKRNAVYVYGSRHSSTNFGIDFIIGMEYKLQKAPVAFSLDLKPFMDFVPDGPFGFWDGALSVRYTF